VVVHTQVIPTAFATSTHTHRGADELPNPVPRILGVVLFSLLAFVIVNVALWHWAQKTAGPAKKPAKKVGAKQLKRQTLRRGLNIPTD